MLVSVDSGGVVGSRHRQSQSSVTQFCCSSTTATTGISQQQVTLFAMIYMFLYIMHDYK